MDSGFVYAPYVPLQVSDWRIVAVIHSNIDIGDVVVRVQGNDVQGSLCFTSFGLCVDRNLDTINVMFDDEGILSFVKSTKPQWCYDRLYTLDDHNKSEGTL